MASILLNIFIFWFLAFAGIIFYRLLTGAIRTDGLLKSSRTGQVSPERVQMLVGTLVALGHYITLALSIEGAHSLPPPPVWVVALLGGTQSIYLVGKWFRRPGA